MSGQPYEFSIIIDTALSMFIIFSVANDDVFVFNRIIRMEV